MLQLGPELFERLNANQWVGNQQPVIYGKGGLSPLAIQLIETKLGFGIPEDFAYLLQNMRDPGGVFFPWASFKKPDYDKKLQWLLNGIEFSVDVNGLWLRRWGKRPATLSDALEIVRRDFKTWPRLLPLHGHRFLAAGPLRSGNPVFSIMGTDIIYYGSNLAHYLAHEFLERSPESYSIHALEDEILRVDVWSDFVDRSSDFLTFANTEMHAAKAIAAVRKLMDVESAPAVVDLKVQSNGDVLIEGELCALGVDFENKLRELKDRVPRPLLCLLPRVDELGGPQEEYEASLRKVGYATMALQVQDDGGRVHWRNLSTWFIPPKRD